MVAQMVKRLLTKWETWAQSLGQEDPLAKEMAPHSSTLALKIPWTEVWQCGRLQSRGSQRVGHDFTFFLSLWTIKWIQIKLYFRKGKAEIKCNNHNHKHFRFMGSIQTKRMGTQTYNFKGSIYILKINGQLNNYEHNSKDVLHFQQISRKNVLLKKRVENYGKKQAQM